MTKPNHELSPALIVLMSIATGLAVASNYYAQPLLDTIARNFSLSASSAGFIVTAAQLGYAAGLLFLVPLGDMFERRRLIVSMTLLAAGGMLITASSQSLAMMILGTALTGLFSVVAQILVPLAATLASPDKRGKVVGTIMSGLLLGILLARTVAGLLANLGGWRTVFWVASVLMALMALALWRGLPQMKSETHLNYPQLLGSVFSMFISDKILRTRALLGCLTFANFSILWTSMAFLLAAPPFNYSDGVIGLFGLAGAAGALGARPAGGFADKGKSHHTTTFGLLLLLLSWLAIWFGHTSVLALITLESQENHSIQPSELSCALGSSRTNATRIADELEKRGWIERRESDNDRRCLHLQLTEKGHEFLREVLPPQHNCLHLLWSALSTTEKDQLEQITRKLLSRLDQMEQDGVVLEAMS